MLANAHPPDLSPEGASRFVAAFGFVVTEVTDTSPRGYAELGPDHHTPWGVVHGGVYATIVENACSAAASHAVAQHAQFAVGVHNATDFLRSSTGTRAAVTATALYQGRTQQLWEVVIVDESTNKVLARGQSRLQNVGLQ